MVKKMLIAAAAISVVGSTAGAFDLPQNAAQARVVVQNMPNEAWLNIMRSSMDFRYLVGKPFVLVVNATNDPITTVVCDGRWQLVGPSPYIKGAPSVVGAHKVSIIPTEGFDKYCKESLVGLTQDGERHDGVLSIPGDFTHSISITFE